MNHRDMIEQEIRDNELRRQAKEPPRPDPCLRCKSALPLDVIPRVELYFYTASVSRMGGQMGIDTDRDPRGRLCDACTRAFAEWLGADSVPAIEPTH